ncbi:amino acid ABC transporter permease [Abyssibius alkaniclasticus]|uniref:amino acid ABC transporter permease n=1 Tax=Abyssibius alkaniclasticus TaxID=2881234 RepID=UPI0023636C68|nr:amino acid ABC transporter permease [Abyssibius alkaniclasticus]UPH72577.1 amino acid ABC transporter permease [Abyssibius alkaniclasticus]
MTNITYVRTEMLPQQAPPPGEVGVVGWLRQNLFSGPFNTILTIVSAAVIIFLAYEILPWFTNSIWNASSLSECREIADGACFAVINERFNQLMFGFYPSELYWRPVLAFVLLLIALAPVLIDTVPKKLLLLTAVYPAIMYLLIWGGSIWPPIFVLAGFVVSAVVFSVVDKLAGTLAAIIIAVLAALFWWLYAVVPVSDVFISIADIGFVEVTSNQLGGFMLSIIIGMTGIALSFPIGIVLALGRQSDMPIVKIMCVGFIEFIRGVPLITLLFTASLLLGYFLPKGTTFDIVLRVMIMVTLFASAYMAEVIRGGLAALPRGQYEAADALGLNYWQAQRLIIMPQALKISIPGIVSTFIGLFKDTTLVSIIGLLDPLGLSSAIRANQAWNGIIWELYGFIALVFFIFCFSMSRYSMYLERKLQTGH